MNILLDTHVLIWALENNPTLSLEAQESIILASNIVFVSSVSVWEIAIKKSLGKLEVPDNLQEEMDLHRFIPLPIDFNHAEMAGRLPFIHKDPFDRMLIVQAMIEKLTLVTRDAIIPKYDIKTLKA